MEQKIYKLADTDIAKLVTALSKLNNVAINIYVQTTITHCDITNSIVGTFNNGNDVIINGYGNNK